MAGGKLSVEIGADITDFEKKIKEVEFDIKELSKVKLDRLKVGLDTTEINSQIKDAKASLNSLKTAVKDTGQTFASTAPKVANAGNTLTQFSRIAQDAPFGIIGIGNNITATAESFSYLKAQTGSTGGALKALASSLAGTGGILLGVSLLTTGLTLLAQSGLSVGDVINKITGNFDEFGAALKKANEEAVKNSAGEIAGMNALVASAQNVNLSMKDRKIAVDELQKTYPGYFGNLSKEQILNGDVKTAVEGVTQALIARAKAQALTEEIVKLAQEQYKLEEDRANLVKKQIGLQKGLAEAQKFATSGAGQAAGGLSVALELVNSELIKNQKELEANANKQAKFTEEINKNVGAQLKLKEELAKPAKAIFNTPQVTGIENNIIPAPLFDVNGIKVFTGQVDQFGNKIKELPGVIKSSLVQIPDIINEGAILMAAALLEFNNSATEIINTSIADTFAGLGSAIGSALATGGNVLESVGKTLLSSLGSILTNMGQMAISIGVGLLGIKAALKSLNPAVAIAAGVGLIALGSFFSSKSSSIGGSIGGGGGASSSSGAGANNQSFSSSGFSGGGGGGTVVFEIAGQKLIGVLNNTLNSNKRLGGTLGLG
jgi:uncharacterized membrane protein YgcG